MGRVHIVSEHCIHAANLAPDVLSLALGPLAPLLPIIFAWLIPLSLSLFWFVMPPFSQICLSRAME